MMAGAKRGRAKKSIEQRKAEGTYRPDRHGKSGPQSTGKPVMPAYLQGEAASLWHDYVPRLEQIGIAKDVDTPALASMCEWWAEYRSAVNETIENENAINRLAEAIEKLAGLASLGLVDEVIEDLSGRVLETIGDLMERRSMQAKRRADRMSKAWKEFFAIAGRFGMTAIDRRAMDDIDPSEGTTDDPIENTIHRQSTIKLTYEDAS